MVKIGSATQGDSPRAVMISSEESDISETSNSWNLSCRQKISEGCAVVTSRSMLSGRTLPSIMG
jgi:hypothetical protein